MTNIPRFSQFNISFIFIDLQQKLLDRISSAARIISNNRLLLEAVNLLEIPSLATTQYRKGLGDLNVEIRQKASGEVPDKITFSCAADESIARWIDGTRRPYTVISGVETHICVMQTALDLLRLGRDVAIVSDAVGARGEEDHRRGLDRMERSGACLVSTEMLIYELLGRSDSEAFKKILPLIKSR